MLSREARHGERALRPAARPLNVRVRSLAAVCAGLAIGGCGADDDAEPATEPGATATELTVTLDADGPGGEAERTETVSCEPGSRCTEIEPITTPDFAPTPPDTACTEIFGGPDTVTIEGTLRGEPVDAQLTRANGCEIERFDRFTPLLRVLFPGYQPGASLAPPG